MAEGEFAYHAVNHKYDLTVKFLADALSEWTGLNFSIRASVLAYGAVVMVEWLNDSDLFKSGGAALKSGQALKDAEMKAWFMLDALWYSIQNNLGKKLLPEDGGDILVYYSMNGEEDLVVPSIDYPKLFPFEIEYMGGKFYYAHKDLNDDDSNDEWIKPVPASAIDYSGMNLYYRSPGHIHSGDEKANLSIYVRADKDADGNFMIADDADWLLTMETSDGVVYPLFPRKYVMLGKVSYVAFLGHDDNKYDLHVIVTVTGFIEHEIYECVFDSAKTGFRKKPLYHVYNVGVIGNSNEGK